MAANAVTVMGAWPDQVALGPFKVGFLPISHSIPESSGLVIDTPEGRVVHTGDFKLDETPLVGEGWDPVLWGEIAKPGVKALVCDSTNVFSLSPGRSEATLGDNITQLVHPPINWWWPPPSPAMWHGSKPWQRQRAVRGARSVLWDVR